MPLAGVALSRSEGLSRWATRCFAAAQHDSVGTPAAIAHYNQRILTTKKHARNQSIAVLKKYRVK
jgi:hypothetical protein